MTLKNRIKNESKGSMVLHIILGIVIVAILAVIILRITQWNFQKTEIEKDDVLDTIPECLDYYVYPNSTQKTLQNADGKEHILLIGNQALSRSSDDSTSIQEILEEKVDAVFVSLIAEDSRMACLSYPNAANASDALGLYPVVTALCADENKSVDQFHNLDAAFHDPADKQKYLDTLFTLDLNTIDTVIIMYDLLDFYNGLASVAEADNVGSVYGALSSSIRLLMENYPHLEIFVSSPYPTYVDWSGEIELSSQHNYFGGGTSSTYVSAIYNATLENFISYIDNYYYVVDEENITEYLEQMRLTPKGVNVIANHIVEFLNK